MKTVAFILAGIMLLLVGGVAVFYFLKKKEIEKAVKLTQQGVPGAIGDIVTAGETLYKAFSGKKSM